MKKYAKMAMTGALATVMAFTAGCGPMKQAEGDKVKVTLWSRVTSDSPEIDVALHNLELEKVKEKFPQYEIEVVYKAVGTDYRQEYDKALMAGNAPDIFTEFSYTDIPTRIKNGTVADITEFVNNWDLKKEDKILDTFDDAISKDNKWYAIPRDGYVMAMLANKKVLDAAGGDSTNLPATWEEFTKVATQVSDKSVPRIGYNLMGFDWCAWPFTAWVWSAGGEMVEKNDDGTYRIAFNDEAGVDAAMYLNELIWKHGATQKNILQGHDEITKALFNGSAVFSWADLSNLVEEELNKYDLTSSDFTMTSMPVKDASMAQPALAGGEVVTFNPKADDKTLKAAFEIASYLYADEEYLTERWNLEASMGSANIKIPARVDLYEKKLSLNPNLDQDTIAGIVEMRKNARPEPYCPNWSNIKTALVAPLQEIFLTENLTREKAKELLDGCAEDIYNKYSDSFKK